MVLVVEVVVVLVPVTVVFEGVIVAIVAAVAAEEVPADAVIQGATVVPRRTESSMAQCAQNAT